MTYFSIGNLKLGKDTIIFNMSPSSHCPSKFLGMCKVGADKCYARKAEKMYPNVLPFRERQMDFWRISTQVQFIQALEKEKTKHIKYLRINESGDFANQGDINRLHTIAKVLLDRYGIITYCYTARADLDFTDVSFIVNGSFYIYHTYNIQSF